MCFACHVLRALTRATWVSTQRYLPVSSLSPEPLGLCIFHISLSLFHFLSPHPHPTPTPTPITTQPLIARSGRLGPRLPNGQPVILGPAISRQEAGRCEGNAASQSAPLSNDALPWQPSFASMRLYISNIIWRRTRGSDKPQRLIPAQSLAANLHCVREKDAEPIIPFA